MSKRFQLMLETKCCCFIPLRTGCFILGYINLFFNSLQTMGIIIFTMDLGISTNGFDHLNNTELVSYAGYETTEMKAMERSFLCQVGLILLAVIVGNITFLIVHISCLAGLHRNKPGPVNVYISFASARLILTFAALIFLILYAPEGLQAIVCHVFGIGFGCYFLVTYYYYAGRLEKKSHKFIMPDLTTKIVYSTQTRTDKV